MNELELSPERARRIARRNYAVLCAVATVLLATLVALAFLVSAE